MIWWTTFNDMHGTLARFIWMQYHTIGQLVFDDFEIFMLERPWIPAETLGGQPFISCIPDGEYELRPYIRRNGSQVLSLVNEALSVYFQKTDRPDDVGRYKNLIHPGNRVSHSEGCLLTGESWELRPDQSAWVSRSQISKDRLMALLDFNSAHSIVIQPAEARDV